MSLLAGINAPSVRFSEPGVALEGPDNEEAVKKLLARRREEAKQDNRRLFWS
jgi:hypothetical protein